jgi:trans-aconitate methyltransferase
VGREDAELLSVSERGARYDAWFSTPLGRAMDAVEARAVIELAAPRPGERALDTGCGTGIYTRRLVVAGARVTGLDSDPEMLAAAPGRRPRPRSSRATSRYCRPPTQRSI